MKKILIYDCEIINCIPNHNKNNDPQLKYCNGWRDFSNMGISVVGTWRNFNTINPFGKYEAFVNNEETNRPIYLKKFEQLEKLFWKADLIIGFNSLAFDDNLLKANGFEVPRTKFDLLVEIRKADGQGDGHYKHGITKPGFALKDLANRNLKINKSLSGELAPVAWQRKKYKKVIDYCLLDVKITKQLYFKFVNNKLLNPSITSCKKTIFYSKIIKKIEESYKIHKDFLKEVWGEKN